MIDLDLMEEQLTSAVTEGPRPPAARAAAVPVTVAPAAPPPRPRPLVPPQQPAATPATAARRVPQPPPLRPPAPAAPSRAADVPELLALGRLDLVDAAIATAHGTPDALVWTTMRALLDGRQDAVRSGLAELQDRVRRTEDPATSQAYWAQRFWAAVEWGTPEERLDVLDHCRERAYRFDDLDWWGNLTLLLATMGKTDEASRAFDAAVELLGARLADGLWVDAVTNLIEGAALLGDSTRVARLHPTLRWPEGRLVVVGPGLVCRGSIERYRALGFSALGRWGDAAECFRAAASAHRAIGAGPLLARTLQQAEQAHVAA